MFQEHRRALHHQLGQDREGHITNEKLKFIINLPSWKSWKLGGGQTSFVFRRIKIILLFQKFAFFPLIKVGENIDFDYIPLIDLPS